MYLKGESMWCPGVHGNLDNLDQASQMPNILLKVDRQKEQMIHMFDYWGSGNTLVLRSTRENAARLSRKKNKRCRSAKNFPTICLQNSFLSNISSCLICDGSNLIIPGALANSNLTVAKPMKRNSKKKIKRKGKSYKKLFRQKGSVGSGIVCEESLCDVSVCESSIINDPSSPEEISENVLSEKAASYSLPVKVSVEKNDSEDCGTDALNSSAVTENYIPCTDEINESKQMAALGDDFAQEVFSCDRTSTDEHSTTITDYSCAEQTAETTITTSSGSTHISNLNDTSFYLSPRQNNTSILDTVLDDGSSVNTTCSGAGVETQLCVNIGSLSSYAETETTCNSQQDIASPCTTSESHKTNIKKPNDFDISAPYGSMDPVHTNNIADRMRCSNEASCSSASNGFLLVKTGKNNRKISGSSSGIHEFGDPITYARRRKEVSHSVWQRVQKKSGVESIYEFEDPHSVSLQHDVAGQGNGSRLKSDASFWMGQSGNGEIHRYPCLDKVADDPVSMRMMTNAVDPAKRLSESGGKSVNKFPEKLKMKSILVPKQGPNHFWKKGPQNGKHDLAQLSRNDKINAVVSSSIPDSNSQRSDVTPTEKSDSFPSKLWVKEKIHANEMTAAENVSNMVHDIDSHPTQNDIGLLARTLDSLDMKCTVAASSDVTGSKSDEDIHPSFYHFSNEKNAGWKPEDGGLCAEHRKQDNILLPGSQKWVPVGKRFEGRSQWKSSTSESVDSFFPELGVMDESQHSPHCISKGHVASNFYCTQAAGDQSPYNFQTDLGNIIFVVKDAYKLQIASENFQLATGSPIAEFERLLYSASPVVGQMYSIRSCNSCSQDQWVGDTLCQHQIPNISLRNLWQWYEKPGNYGLEVKVEDYLSPKRLGSDKFNFRAYFVPYLSAVQLFGWSKGCTCSNNCISDRKIDKEHETDNMHKKSSQLSNLPIFSLLVPRPRKEAVIQVPESPSSSSSEGESSNSSFCKACSMAEEVLFEYFESDQPQLRRPLLGKIKDLVKGSQFSNSQIFGDPLKLECLNLHDLHPASWFSVAWYPIYRIPDGNFRAAFLTYHSLGHFTHRSALLESADGISHIVSPVVGLQSYNDKCGVLLEFSICHAGFLRVYYHCLNDCNEIPEFDIDYGNGINLVRVFIITLVCAGFACPLVEAEKDSWGECWFRQRGSQSVAVQTGESSTPLPSEILKERLRTLERTASVMSRTSVPKGDHRSVNRQPDYEFFLSRSS